VTQADALPPDSESAETASRNAPGKTRKPLQVPANGERHHGAIERGHLHPLREGEPALQSHSDSAGGHRRQLLDRERTAANHLAAAQENVLAASPRGAIGGWKTD